MKKWQIEYKVKSQSASRRTKFKVDDLVKILLENRGFKTKKEIEDFLNPKLSDITIDSLKINKSELKKALLRIKKAIKEKQKIIIYGDYDVDGVCASAILWETLNSLKANVMPFIPSRFEEGYGLSEEGINNLLRTGKVDLIITVDNGIVANSAVNYANKKGIDVIITDHHLPPVGGAKELPKAFAIVHTTSLCGAGVAYMLSREISDIRYQISDAHLELVVLATIADLVPLTAANRILVYFGLKKLRQTKRPGLLSLINDAKIKKEELDVYEIGHIIAPRLNAMGRLLSAMDSLRLICTTSKIRADDLSHLLSKTNLLRQQISTEALNHAKNKVKEKEIKNLIFIADESYSQGIIGLVAGRLVEEYYLPSIVISKGKKYSKASVRSVKGFNIIEFLRTASDLLVDVGGHPMAAGFTVETKNLELLEKKLFENAKKLLKQEHLERSLRIDTELDYDFINNETYLKIQKLKPFGMGNPEPTFVTRNMIIENIRLVGNEGKHLKINFKYKTSNLKIEGIAFGMGEGNGFKIGDSVDVVYVLSENEWNGNKSLQLMIKDLRKN